jgi:hypothetical protein
MLCLPDTALQAFQLSRPIGCTLAANRTRFLLSSRRAPKKKEISYKAIHAQFSKWSHDGSLKRLWQGSILTIRPMLDLSVLNLDGTQSLAKRGGEKVAYQGRKKGKTSNILPIIDRNGYVIASTGIKAPKWEVLALSVVDNSVRLWNAHKGAVFGV